MSASTLAVAKKRAARRRDGAGAVMFVVAMTLAVLASLGLYALAAASTEMKTSGYERQNAQTHYLAEYGVITAAHEINPLTANVYFGQMINNNDPTCLSVPNPPVNSDIMVRACRRIRAVEFAKVANGQLGFALPALDPYAGPVAFTPNVLPGSLGPIMEQGDFYVELTEPVLSKPPVGFGLNQPVCFVNITVWAGGITQPMIQNNDTALFGGEGLEIERARFVAGPINASCN
jgi:hypothetical protein